MHPAHGMEKETTSFTHSSSATYFNENEEKPRSSQLHQSQRDEGTEVELFASISTEPRTLKVEADTEDCGGSQPATNSGPHNDMQQLLVIKEELLHEHQECKPSVDHVDIKEEGETLWISQQRQQQHQLEETDITKLVFTGVPVKSECNDEKPQSSQLHQSQSDEGTEAEPVASSSSVHRILTTQADGEEDGGPQPASNLGPNSNLQPDRNGRSSDTSDPETDDSCDWKQTRELHSGFDCQTNNTVSKHYRRMKASGKPFACSECGKRFGRNGSRIRHMRIHTGQKPFDCSECGKRFGQKGCLVRHMKIHTGEKPFDCSECSERFVQKSDMNKHMRIHTGEKPFDCSECCKRFGQKGGLIRHMRIHTGEKPFDCSACGKRFGYQSSLSAHMRIHTGEKPFACSDCGKIFRHQGNLMTHMRIHMGQKPYSCSECGKRFRQKSTLITHMRSHTNRKEKHKVSRLKK
ncbi:zinc finger protein 391-like [Thalassophryne amazonica]|uniref:zinc finger protein 391-like n=1 Tax=Thalassophryne amazonica TaxID=390379 RepID=UPI001470EB89|nr:zinc finger protein 391-like [Thalassophryne amazonica]